VGQIDRNPHQPRREFDEGELDSLAESIREHGLLQPILVRRAGERYQLIAGERRLRASMRAGLSEVPAHLREADDRQMAELAIVENLQRKDLSALEKAQSFQEYLSRYGATQEELATRLAIDRSTISNLIRLLELPEEVRRALASQKISQGHARALLPLGDEREQTRVCRRIQEEGWSVRTTEEQVQAMILDADAEPLALPADSPAPRGKKVTSRQSQQVAALEQQLRALLGTKVEIKQTARGRGRLVIHFKNHQEFERLCTQLGEPYESDGATRRAM
jgi:ParB family chromosome partitioning protein